MSHNLWYNYRGQVTFVVLSASWALAGMVVLLAGSPIEPPEVASPSSASEAGSS